MKLLILTQYFPPEMGAPQARLVELGSFLRNLGWDVQVLTALPNYPTGKIFPDYLGKGVVCENISGIAVIRTWLIPSKSKKTIPRMFCYLSFALSALMQAPKRCVRPDLILVETPPLFLGITARILAKKWKIPFVLNVSDLWPDSFINMGRLRQNDFSYKILKKLELLLYREASGVTGQSSEIIRAIIKMMPGIGTQLVTNGVTVSKFGKYLIDPNLRNTEGWNDKIVFVYAGLHGLAQGLDQIIKAAISLRDDNNILFVLFGDGPVKGELEALAQKERLTNVKFYPPQLHTRIPAILASADVALVTLGSAIYGAVPSKIYEAMASEIPILLVAEGEPVERVVAASAGLTVKCNDIDGLVDAICRLANSADLRLSLGRSGRKAAESTYSRESIAIQLSSFLKRVVDGELLPLVSDTD